MEDDSAATPQKVLKPQLKCMFEHWLLAKRNPLPSNREEMIERVTALLDMCSIPSRTTIISTKTAAKNFLQRQHSQLERQIRNSPSDIRALQLFRSFLGLGESAEGNEDRSSGSFEEDPFAFDSGDDGKSKTPSKKSPSKAKVGGRRSKTSPESGGRKAQGIKTLKKTSPTRVELDEEVEEVENRGKSTQAEETERKMKEEEEVVIEFGFSGMETAQKKSHEVKELGKEPPEGGGGASTGKRPREGLAPGQDKDTIKASRIASKEVLKPSARTDEEKAKGGEIQHFRHRADPGEVERNKGKEYLYSTYGFVSAISGLLGEGDDWLPHAPFKQAGAAGSSQKMIKNQGTQHGAIVCADQNDAVVDGERLPFQDILEEFDGDIISENQALRQRLTDALEERDEMRMGMVEWKCRYEKEVESRIELETQFENLSESAAEKEERLRATLREVAGLRQKLQRMQDSHYHEEDSIDT